MRKIMATMVAVGAFAFAGAANAAILDFTDPTTPLSTAAYTVTSTGGVITNSQPQDGSTCATKLPVLACEVDGLGVTDDEVTNTIRTGESLTITFNQDVAIDGIALLDLFQNRQGGI
ncbi:MAG: hypothetical protein GC153_08120, partial [Alphaproteobacteria bacterium]|nr:hypothetical protein [Alphaproteobacteria bacterium]